MCMYFRCLGDRTCLGLQRAQSSREIESHTQGVEPRSRPPLCVRGVARGSCGRATLEPLFLPIASPSGPTVVDVTPRHCPSCAMLVNHHSGAKLARNPGIQVNMCPNIGPESVELAKFSGIWQNLGRSRSRLGSSGQIRPKWCRDGPSWAEFDRKRPNFARVRLMPASFGPISTTLTQLRSKFPPVWADVDGIWSKLGQSC